jgi:hypothetical protein
MRPPLDAAYTRYPYSLFEVPSVPRGAGLGNVQAVSDLSLAAEDKMNMKSISFLSEAARIERLAAGEGRGSFANDA